MKLPIELEKHKDKVLYNEGYWLVLAGINHNGISDHISKDMVYVLYKNEKYWHYQWVAGQIYLDKDLFWKYVRSRVASELRQLRKEIEK